jgi:recA bacterial DNA recombination protein
MGALQALVLDRLLEAEGLAKKPGGLLSGLGARLCRASELASPAAQKVAQPTAVPALDRLLSGGLPKGSLVELTGRRSSGRFSLGLAALAAATSSGQAAALVDLGDHLDPQAAQLSGIDLRYLLWARPRRVKEALAASEMLLAAGFPLVVADLGLATRTRFVPDATWVRLARSAQAQGATLLLSTPWRSSGIAADAVVSAAGGWPVWQGSGKTPRLLAGLSSRLILERLGRSTPGLTAPFALSVAECHPESLGSARDRLREGSPALKSGIPRRFAPRNDNVSISA